MATSVVKKIRRSGRVGIYARVTSAGREHLKSLAAQVSSFTRYVSDQEGWLLVDVYMDTGSDRIEFDRLVNDCKSYDLDCVIEPRLPANRNKRRQFVVLETLKILTVQGSGLKIIFRIGGVYLPVDDGLRKERE